MPTIPQIIGKYATNKILQYAYCFEGIWFYEDKLFTIMIMDYVKFLVQLSLSEDRN